MMTTSTADAAAFPALLDALLALVPPAQYLDAFVLDANGYRAVDNAPMKAKYGF